MMFSAREICEKIIKRSTNSLFCFNFVLNSCFVLHLYCWNLIVITFKCVLLLRTYSANMTWLDLKISGVLVNFGMSSPLHKRKAAPVGDSTMPESTGKSSLRVGFRDPEMMRNVSFETFSHKPFAEVLVTRHIVLHCVKRSCISVASQNYSLSTLVTLTISHYHGFSKLVEAEVFLQINPCFFSHSIKQRILPLSAVIVSLHHLPKKSTVTCGKTR